MKTNSIVTIQRNNKEIVIWVKDRDWNSIPDLSFIEDVEIYQPECRYKQKTTRRNFLLTDTKSTKEDRERSKREDHESGCGALNSMET